MQITQPLHTSINVTNLEKAEYFYGEVLGLSKVERSRQTPGAWYQIGNYQIHLIVVDKIINEPKHEKWGRNPHIAFSVSDLDAAKQQLLNYNFPIQASASGRPAIFTQDLDGNIIELSAESGV
jgi:glyoxylase I family protein